MDCVRWKTGQESIRNEVFGLEGKAKMDGNIIIHDDIRPLAEPSVLSDAVSKCSQFGNAVTSMPYNEQIFVIDEDDETTTSKFTPQEYRFDLLDQKYHEAFEKEIGIYVSHYTNTMMVEFGMKLHSAAGLAKNIKLTTKDDLEMFEAYLKADKDTLL